MTVNTIKKNLEQALLHNGKMHLALYKYELEEMLGELRSSLEEDNDDFIFSITENQKHVAMVLVDKSGQVYINEKAREKLQALWPAAYAKNMKLLIPAFAEQLFEGELPLNGVKIVEQL